jgi:hypothetical protein
MSQQNENGFKAFTATSAVTAYRRVKLTSGSGTAVEHAGAGEEAVGIAQINAGAGEMVTVALLNRPGTFKMCAHAAITVGATLYGVAAGRVDDSGTGSTLGLALEAATAQDDIIEVALQGTKSTTAATVSITDTADYFTGATVELALAELGVNAMSAQAFIPIPLTSIREATSNDIPNAAGNGGLLAKDTTPIFEFTNGDTDSCLRLNWAASNSDALVFQVPLPPDLNDAAAVVIHFRAAMEGATDTPVISADSYFNDGDTKVEDDSAAVTGATAAEYTITIAAADVPAGAQTLTCELTPGAHTTDKLFLYAIWIEYTKKILTS